MKRVWKCDFCSHIGTQAKTVERHEKTCPFNPINKSCYSCDNRLPGAYYDSCDECKIHDFGYFISVEDGDIKCKDWTNIEERSKKIKLIKNKIN
jgi:hypothetical protein